MKTVRQTRQAKADIIELWLRIAAADEATANRIVDDITHRIAQLEAFPEMGPARPDIAADARSLRCERWLILYRITPDAVQIVRVVDGARDLSKLEL